MNDWIVTLIVLIVPAVFIVIAVRRKWLTRPRGSFTGLTVYHDWINQDMQRGVEVIIERNAGAREEEDESGDRPFDGSAAPPEEPSPH